MSRREARGAHHAHAAGMSGAGDRAEDSSDDLSSVYVDVACN